MLLGRPRFAAFAIGLALLCAIPVIRAAPQSVFPAIRLARVEVFADAGDLRAEDVRARIAAPLERRLAALPHLIATRAFCDPGKLEIELDFDPNDDPQRDLAAVRAALAGEQTVAPDRIATLVEGPEAEPVVTYAFRSATLDQAHLARRIETLVASDFIGVPDLGRTAVFGGPQLAYDVDLGAKAASARAIATALAAATAPREAGTIVRGRERFALLAGSPPSDAASLAATLVPARAGGPPVRLGTLARVRASEEPTGRQASFDGEHAVLLNLYTIAGGDALRLARAAAQRVPELRGELPSDVRIDVAWDQTRLIERSQAALQLAMLSGAAIALLAIAFFLRSWSLTSIAALVLPLALAFTLWAIVRAGLGLDVMTMGGLAIAIGLVIDETIVVLEAIARALDAEGAVRATAIAAARRRIARPLLASTLANIVVFAPLGLLGGIAGYFFRALALTLSIALAISIALSLWLAPLLANALRASGGKRSRVARLEAFSLRYLGVARRVPGLVLVLAVASIAVAGALLARTPTGFLPDVEEGQFEIKYALPPGMSLAAADDVANLLERTILIEPAVAHVARLSGVDTDGFLATPPDAGTLRVQMRPGTRVTFDRLADHLRATLESASPDAAFEFHQLLEDQINDLSGAPEPIQLRVTGPSQAQLNAIAGHIANDLQDVEGIVDLFDGVTYEARSILAVPPRNEAPDAFADDLRAHADGIVATEIPDDEGPIPVLVRAAPHGTMPPGVRLAAPAFSTTVREDDGRRDVLVTAGLEGVDLSTATAEVERRIAPVIARLPPGYRVELGGAIAEQRAAFADFARVFALALLLVCGVLVATFDSYRLPLIVLAAVPLTPLGVAAALALTRTPLNVASFMGLLLLIGIVVRNAILFVDAAQRREREGASALDATHGALAERLRPIAMTTLATLGALAPLALGAGAGAELERPLATAVIGGILASTVLTMAVVPLLYLVTAPRRGATATTTLR